MNDPEDGQVTSVAVLEELAKKASDPKAFSLHRQNAWAELRLKLNLPTVANLLSEFNAACEMHYPAEELAAFEMGLHPDEARPRASTFLHERRNWQTELEQAREYIRYLEEGGKPKRGMKKVGGHGSK